MNPIDDPERVILASIHAIERARSKGRDEIEPDDLLIGHLYAVSRFGIARIGPIDVDLVALGLRFDLAEPQPSVKPRYSARAASYFDRAARIARADGGGRLAPIHFLAALGEPGIETFDRLCAAHGLNEAGWRAALAASPRPQAEIAGVGAAAAPSAVAPFHAQDLLTSEEAAQLLGMHIQTVRGYIRGGKLPAFRIAGERAIRIRRDDVLSLLEAMAPETSRAP